METDQINNSEKLIVKIKYADFVKYIDKYGTDDKVEQIVILNNYA